MPIQGTKPFKHQKYAFEVQIPGFKSAAFQKCSELSKEVEVGRFVRRSLIPHKQPGLLTYADVTLERGAYNDKDFYDWAEQCGDAAQNAGNVEPITKADHRHRPDRSGAQASCVTGSTARSCRSTSPATGTTRRASSWSRS